MVNRLTSLKALVALVAVSQLIGSAALADVISPKIKESAKKYSSDVPDKTFYGTGTAGRLTAASAARFDAERELTEGNIEEAIKAAGRAVHFDPGDPQGHLLYARAITAKFYSNEDVIDEKLLKKCYEEWMLIWRHDADQEEQHEARIQAKRLARIAKALEKKRAQEEKQKQETIAEAKKLKG